MKFPVSGGHTVERVRYIRQKGKKILHLNFDDRKADEVLAVIDQARAAIRTQAR